MGRLNRRLSDVLCIFNSLPTAFLSSADFFQNQIFQKHLSGIPSDYQTNWIQIRPHIMSGLVWVQSVCKDYEQTTLVGNELRLTCNV